MLRYGTTRVSVAGEVLDQEVDRIVRLGVTILTSSEVQDLDGLRKQAFDAIFLSLGTQLSRLIPIEGKDLPFVLGGLDFLKSVRGGENPRVGPRRRCRRRHVAIDVALTAVRQGGRRVDMVCLEKRREMPAHSSEIETALAEGVAMPDNSWGPVRVSPDHVFTAQRCTRVFDERGRFSPTFDPDTILSLDADTVMLAIGQATDLACVEAGSLVGIDAG